MFVHWEGPVTAVDVNPTTVRVDWEPETTRTVTGVFEESDARYELKVVSVGGTLVLQPSQPSGGYPINSIVTVKAEPKTGYVFDVWQGGLTGRANPATITLDSHKSITAVFNPTVDVFSSPAEGGTVILDPPRPLYGYLAGSDLTLRAAPAEGYKFAHWSGDLSGTSSTATLIVDAPKVIAANFVKENSFPWWWIGAGVVLLVAALMVIFVMVGLGRARTDRQEG